MRSGKYITQSTGYKAYIPSNLPPKPSILIVDDIKNLLIDANMAIGKIDAIGEFVPNIEHIIAMYIRKEALLSSQIEGTQASLDDIFEYESKIPLKNINDVEEVINYIKALNHGIERLKEFPMSIRLIKEIHKILLQQTRGDNKTPGEFRKTQNWIGPPGSTLMSANFVPPTPHDALDAMSNLEKYLHRNLDLPILIDCALIHYQFETIHPFLDGNGRLGRLLITFFLHWKKTLKKPLLYLSYFFKLHRQEYYDRLNLVRDKGDYEQWIIFFLKGVIWSSESALLTIKKILNLADSHRKLLISKKIATPLAIAFLEYLFEKPHVSIKNVSKYLDISFQSAKTLITQFSKLKILKEITGKKRDMRFSYWEYITILSEGTS